MHVLVNEKLLESSGLSAHSIDEFDRKGLLKLKGAFDAESAHKIETSLWARFGEFGIERNRPETWQDLGEKTLREVVKRTRKHKGLQVLYSDKVDAAAHVLSKGEQMEQQRPLLLLTFQGMHDYIEDLAVPRSMWHTDTPNLPGMKPAGIIVLAFVNEVKARGGGTMVVSGSHRFFPDSTTGLSSRVLKRRLRKYSYFRELIGGSEMERERFLTESSVVNGVEVQVVELTGNAGDAYLVNGALLHTLTRNYQEEPRLMMRGFYGSTRLTEHYNNLFSERKERTEESAIE